MNEASKNRLLIIVIAILLLTNISMIVFCVMRSPEKKNRVEDKMKHEGIAELLKKQVGFTPEQVTQYEQLRNDHWKRMKPLFDDMRAAKQGFYKLLNQPAISDTTLQRTADRIGETQKAIDMELFSHFRQVKAICTPEQQPKYDSLVQTVINKMTTAFRKGGSVSFRKDSFPGGR